jgi:hypothetical protein
VLRSNQFGVYDSYRDKKVVGVFVRFHAPLHLPVQAWAVVTSSAGASYTLCRSEQGFHERFHNYPRQRHLQQATVLGWHRKSVLQNGTQTPSTTQVLTVEFAGLHAAYLERL